MKTPKNSMHPAPDHRARSSSSRGFALPPSAGAAALALSLLSASTASAEVIAGIDVFSGAAAPTVTVLAADITATAAATSSGTLGTGEGTSRGSSDDGTWGAATTVTPAPSTAAGTANNQNWTVFNGAASAEMTLTITNNGSEDYDLSAFHMDALAFRPNAPRTYALNVLAGSDITIGNVFTSATDAITSQGGLPPNFDSHDDIDISLTGLADHTLEAGGVAIIQIAFSDGSGSGPGHHLWVDNIAVSGDIATDNKLVFTTTFPANVTAGTDFPTITVQVQDGSNQAVAVSQDTEIILLTTGAGALTGNTATITTGNSSVDLDFLQATKAEDITLIAARTSGDVVGNSDPSSTITIDAAAASQLIVETAADGSGVPVGDLTLYPTNTLTVYSISRDAFDNFVANETATWSLENITGNIVSGDLIDNTDGSATLTANDLGTTNIRATFSGFPDADSGLITVEELIHRFTGAGGNGSWQTVANWTGSILPDFSGPDSATDLFFSESTNTKGSPYLGADITVRSLNYDNDSTASFNNNFVLPGNTNPANLTFDTDSLTEPAELNIDAAFTKALKLGFSGSVLEENAGTMILADDLLVTHDGSANAEINIAITGAGGLTKAGTGTLIISGTNTYTGDTVVDDGLLVIDGDSIEDTGTLIIGGGMVEVTGNEVVGALDLGSGPVADGIYGSSSSSAPVENQDDGYFSGTGTVEVITPPESGFSTWIAGTFANGTVTNQGPDDDDDNDGISNLLEYAVAGLDPTVGDASVGTFGSNTLTVGKRQPLASDITYAIEQSTDLGVSDPWETVTPTTNDDTEISYALPGGPTKDFMRLKVTQP